VGVVAGLLVGGAAWGQDSIALRAWARIEERRAVTLADVAELRGDAAVGLGGLVVGEAGATRVDLAAVRRALEGRVGTNLGRLTLSGSACAVRVGAAMSTVAPAAGGATAPAGAALETVRTRVAAKIAEVVGVEAAGLRLAFDEGAAGRALLGMGVAGRTVVVQPAGAGERMPLSVRVYEGDRLLASGTVRVGVLVRREVVVARRDLTRGAAFDAERVGAETRWVEPGVSPAAMADVLAATARGRVDAGGVIETRHIETPLAVKKGDLVAVDCLSGSVAVRRTARARAAGREGDVIEVQTLESRKSFRARVSGPGTAVLVVAAPGMGEGSER